jgi:CDP-diacylglycerol---glycerol-3-phosphate 3-phosphatidyltransferase
MVMKMNEVETPKSEKSPWSFEMFLRKTFKGVIDPIAKFFLSIGFKPNTVTFLGLIITTVAAAFIVKGNIILAGFILLVGAPLDVIDGAMARQLGHPSNYGAFIDSVTDRYAELVIMLGLLIHFVMQSNLHACIVVFVAAGGSVMVSYVKARAESVGYSGKTGILTRVERLIVMITGLVFNIPLIALWIIAVLANVTALQRILFVRKQAMSVKSVES